MLSARRVLAFYALPVVLLISGMIVWVGDINWWDDPLLSPSFASPVRMIHTLFGFGALMLFGTVYWHSKVHWKKGSSAKKWTGILLWGLLAIIMLSALILLYSDERLHTVGVLAHSLTGIFLLIMMWAHRIVAKR